MSKFVFTPELTKEEAQQIIDALNFQFRHQRYKSKITYVIAQIETKRLVTKLRTLAKLCLKEDS